MMTFNDQNLIELLGRPLSDPRVQRLLSQTGIPEKKIRLKRGDSDVAVEDESLGLVLNFEEASDSLNLPEGTLVLCAVHAMAHGVQGHTAFAGVLPLELNFQHTRAQVREILGAPHWSSPVLPRDRWHHPAFRLSVGFRSDKADAGVADVTVSSLSH